MILSDANSIHTKRWVSSLSTRGIYVVLFSLTKSKDNFYKDFECVKIFGLGKDAKDSVISKFGYLSVVSKLKNLIKEEKPNILHAHYASSYGLLGALAKCNAIPYIISVWGSDVYDFPNITPFGKQIIRYNLSRADHILSTSHVMAKETAKYTDKPIAITPFGVDVELFKPSPHKESEEFVIGNVKTLRPKYGIDVLIKAADIFIKNNPEKKIRLDIYGEGPQKEELVELTKELGIEDKVNFKGFVQNTLLPDVYNSVSVSVSVSDSESFGVVAVEAMACGCPVITSDADGFTEVVKDGETGFIVPKRNPEATAAAIQKFIDNPQLRHQMGKKGRERVLTLYNWEDNVQTMVDIYNTILKTNVSN